jgi:N-formylmaleamate deformylase
MAKTWQEDTILVNGARFHYWRTGGERPPLVMFHGFSDYGLCWVRVAKALEGHYDVLLPDARGHGLSERFKLGEKVDIAADAAAFIRALELKQPILMGHSMGAVTAFEVAARFPELASAIVLEDPPWFPRQHKSTPSATNPFEEYLSKIPGHPQAEVEAQCRKENPGWHNAEISPWAQSKLQFDLNIFKTERRRGDWHTLVPKVTCPALLLTGDPSKSAIVRPATARSITRRNPNFQVAHIFDTGHCIHRDRFEAAMEAMLGFLESLHGLEN